MHTRKLRTSTIFAAVYRRIQIPNAEFFFEATTTFTTMYYRPSEMESEQGRKNTPTTEIELVAESC